MGLYIKGFKKKPCAECMFRGYERCLLTDEYLGVDAEYMPEECPLIEVKAPHGRLIDATEVITKINDSESAVFISKAPTVIKSEEE